MSCAVGSCHGAFGGLHADFDDCHWDLDGFRGYLDGCNADLDGCHGNWYGCHEAWAHIGSCFESPIPSMYSFMRGLLISGCHAESFGRHGFCRLATSPFHCLLSPYLPTLWDFLLAGLFCHVLGGSSSLLTFSLLNFLSIHLPPVLSPCQNLCIFMAHDGLYQWRFWRKDQIWRCFTLRISPSIIVRFSKFKKWHTQQSKLYVHIWQSRKYLRAQQCARARKDHVGTYVLSSEEVNLLSLVFSIV